jgi:hypothetical protein
MNFIKIYKIKMFFKIYIYIHIINNKFKELAFFKKKKIYFH